MKNLKPALSQVEWWKSRIDGLADGSYGKAAQYFQVHRHRLGYGVNDDGTQSPHDKTLVPLGFYRIPDSLGDLAG
jgi:hypothetical protein